MVLVISTQILRTDLLHSFQIWDDLPRPERSNLFMIYTSVFFLVEQDKNHGLAVIHTNLEFSG